MGKSLRQMHRDRNKIALEAGISLRNVLDDEKNISGPLLVNRRDYAKAMFRVLKIEHLNPDESEEARTKAKRAATGYADWIAYIGGAIFMETKDACKGLAVNEDDIAKHIGYRWLRDESGKRIQTLDQSFADTAKALIKQPRTRTERFERRIGYFFNRPESPRMNIFDGTSTNNPTYETWQENEFKNQYEATVAAAKETDGTHQPGAVLCSTLGKVIEGVVAIEKIAVVNSFDKLADAIGLYL